MNKTSTNPIELNNEGLLAKYVQDGGFTSNDMSVMLGDIELWVTPKEYFNPLEMNILGRIVKEGSEALWKAIDVSKLEKALVIARSFKKKLKDA
jgi:hypothetical protein